MDERTTIHRVRIAAQRRILTVRLGTEDRAGVTGSAGVPSRHRGDSRMMTRAARVVLVVPAHNEEQVIEGALRSVERQTRVPDRRIVMCDNCTDGTAAVAERLGWEVWHSDGNRHKKAGALNQAWDRLESELRDEDFLVVMDADSHLDERFVEAALATHEEAHYGGVGGTFRGRDGGGFVGMLQRNEYVRYMRETRQKQGKVMVLTGTATVFRVNALRDVIAARRAGTLPAGSGSLYDTEVLTEDNELSLALRTVGYRIVSPKECTLTTEVMETWGDLAKQRLRWKRGAIENCRQYGLTRVTLEYWWRQLVSFVGLVVTAAYLGSLAFAFGYYGSIQIHPVWLAVTGVFMVERVVSVRKRGPLQMLLAAVLVVEMTFDVFLQAIHARALWQALWQKETAW
jgi:cellulose synthase/poly-beta-1,6-N-acetylglucosamine synthase-like glycosyltransferase